MSEPDVLELGEHLAQMLGEQREGLGSLVVTAVDASLVDRVVAAEEDATVVGGPVVVELIAHVRQPLTTRPPDRVPLRLGERLSHEDVVVDRYDVVRQPSQQRRKCVGGKDNARRCHCAFACLGLRAHGDTDAVAVAELGGPGLLVDAHAECQAGIAQSPGESRGIDEPGGELRAQRPEHHR